MTTCARSAPDSSSSGRSSARSTGPASSCSAICGTREPVPVGHGQTRRGWVVTAELCWSRVIAGALIFSKEEPDILWGWAGALSGSGRCRRSWCGTARARSTPAAGAQPTRSLASAGSSTSAGSSSTPVTRRPRACWSARTGSCARTSSPAGGSPTRWTSSCSSTAGATAPTAGCTARSAPSASSRARADAAAPRAAARLRSGVVVRVAQQPFVRRDRSD